MPLKPKLDLTREFLAHGQVMPALLALLLLVANPIGEHPARWRVLLASTLGVVAGCADDFVHSQWQRVRHTLYAADSLRSVDARWIVRILVEKEFAAGIGLLLCLALFVGNQWQSPQEYYSNWRYYMSLGRYGNLCTARDIQKMRRLQSSIPPGKQLLVSLPDGYLLDFSRNPIWNLDVPGMVSPPPGMPVTDDPDAVLRIRAVEKVAHLVRSSRRASAPRFQRKGSQVSPGRPASTI